MMPVHILGDPGRDTERLSDAGFKFAWSPGQSDCAGIVLAPGWQQDVALEAKATVIKQRGLPVGSLESWLNGDPPDGAGVKVMLDAAEAERERAEQRHTEIAQALADDAPGGGDDYDGTVFDDVDACDEPAPAGPDGPYNVRFHYDNEHPNRLLGVEYIGDQPDDAMIWLPTATVDDLLERAERGTTAAEFGADLPSSDGVDVHPSTQRFLDTLRLMWDTHVAKGADYGRVDDPFANVRASEDFGIPGWVGCMTRGNDKMRRLQKAAQGGTLLNEGIADSLLDLAVYSVIGYVLFMEAVADDVEWAEQQQP